MSLTRPAALLSAVFALALGASAHAGTVQDHFNASATYVPASGKTGAAVAVTFVSKDPDVHINEEPAPRLKLGDQTILVDKQAPAAARMAAVDPAIAKYLDLAKPVQFPVALASGVAKGTHAVTATVTIFYCSKKEGWCRKGNTEVAVPVTVP